MRTKKIVITGGPGTGKTSVINKLESSNFYCFHEVIRDMTKNAKEKENVINHASNPLLFVSDPDEFNNLIMKGRIQQFKKEIINNKNIAFYDRGIPDVLAYMDFFKQQYKKEFIEACENCIYDQVFIFPPWEDIYVSDNERGESFDESAQIHQNLLHTYKKYGYECIEVPFGTINERTDFIIKNS